ncbi:MAG: rhomboid family intramembrane serine protease [Bacteroidota bacterium]
MLLIYFIILFELVISVLSFAKSSFREALIGHPYSTDSGEWYRLFTAGCVQVDAFHIFVNMYSLYNFAFIVMGTLCSRGRDMAGRLLFLLLYLGGILSSNLAYYYFYREDADYYHLGASAGVVSVMVAAIVWDHSMEIRLWLVPKAIRGKLFLPLYLIGSFLLKINCEHAISILAHGVGGGYGLAFGLCTRLLYFRNGEVRCL